MPHRKSRALASLALAAALATALPAHASPTETAAFFDCLASLVERAWGWVVPEHQQPIPNWLEKAGPYPDPNGQPSTDPVKAGPFPDPNG